MISKFTAKFLREEGGSSGFYCLKESKTIGFKEFYSKSAAKFAYRTQKQLSKFGLAPKVYGKICKIQIDVAGYYFEPTGWGFLTQIAKVRKRLSRKKIQKLVDNISKKTQLSFWDCHEYNIGIINDRYVCIDTGKESFDRLSNAWGNINPGPFCKECNNYNCKCYWN